MRKFFIIIFLFFALNIAACQYDSVDDRIYNENPPISGIYKIKSYVNKKKWRDIPSSNELYAVFKMNRAFIIDQEYRNINYIAKRVRALDYINYSNFGEIVQLDEEEHLFVITIYEEEMYVAEILIMDDGILLNYRNVIYFANRQGDISDSRYQELVRGDHSFNSIIENISRPKNSAAFVGLRQDRESGPMYYTLFLYTDGENTSVFTINDLFVPKGIGYMCLSSERLIDGGYLKDSISADFIRDFSERNNNKPNLNKKYMYMDLVKMQYVSPYLVSLSTVEAAVTDSGIRSNLETYSLEKSGLKSMLSIHDFFGPDPIPNIVYDVHPGLLNSNNYEIDPYNLGIYRRNGYWALRVRLNSIDNYGRFDDVSIRSSSIIPGGEPGQSIMMEDIKRLFTSASDYTASPERNLALVYTPSSLKVISLGDDFNIKDTVSLANNNYKIIMSEWSVGGEAETHMSRIENSEVWNKIQ